MDSIEPMFVSKTVQNGEENNRQQKVRFYHFLLLFEGGCMIIQWLNVLVLSMKIR